MNDPNHKIIQDLLKDIFGNVNNWLVHVEAKNAALVAFNIACLSFVSDIKDTVNVDILYYIVCAGMLLSTVLALISFFPKMGKETKDQSGHSDRDNLIFYMDMLNIIRNNTLKQYFYNMRKQIF